jgi:hypothetical protein
MIDFPASLVAVAVGFEPTEDLHPGTLSRSAAEGPSAVQHRHRYRSERSFMRSGPGWSRVNETKTETDLNRKVCAPKIGSGSRPTRSLEQWSTATVVAPAGTGADGRDTGTA